MIVNDGTRVPNTVYRLLHYNQLPAAKN